MSTPGLKLGCIADDFTGGTDLANNLVRGGMRVVQTVGVPEAPIGPEVDAVVVALKSRTIPAGDAVAQSLAALAWLRAQGAQQIFFKVCSTFDSTPAGNIGPVSEALMEALGCDFTVATPAFPDNARTVFKGHLFVGDVLLSDSGMKNHPLTPMTDANLVRVLQAQCRRRVGLIDHRVVAAGADAVRARIAVLRSEGAGLAICDAVSNDDLLTLGTALKGFPLVTGGSGLAMGLPTNWGLQASPSATALPAARGHRAVVAGSCSVATQGQVAHFKNLGAPSLALDVDALLRGQDVVGAALAWATPRLGSTPVLVYSTATPEAVTRLQHAAAGADVGARVEQALAAVAAGLVQRGVGQLVVAGGETSGACVQALEIDRLQIGPQIDPGVPWCHAEVGGQGLHLALKSGNFGAPAFFSQAFDLL